MKLRLKLTLIAFLFLVTVILALYPLTSLMMLKTFENLEVSQAKQDMNVILETLDNEVETLSTSCEVFSTGQSTFDVLDRSNATGRDFYKHSKMDISDFKSLNVDYIVIVDDRGKPQLFRGFMTLLDKEIDVPSSVLERIKTDLHLWYTNSTIPSEDDMARGFLMIEESLFMFASEPVVNRTNPMEVAGTVLMLRLFTIRTLRTIVVRPTENLDFFSPKEGSDYIPGGYERIVNSNPDAIVVATESESVLCYACVSDPEGKPLFYLKAEMSRQISSKAQDSVIYYFLLTAVVFLGGIAFLGLMTEYTVIRRLSGMSEEVERISPESNIQGRVGISGSDEITKVGNSINSMLDSIDKGRTSLSESEEKYRKLVKASPTGICIIVDDRIAYMNETGAKTMGLLDPSAMHGRDVREFLPQDEAGLVGEVDKELTESGQVVPRELKVIRPDGKTLQVQMMASRTTYQERDAVMINFLDITELQRARKEMTDREMRYRTLYELSSDSIMLLKDGQIISCNNATLEILARDMSEVKGRGLEDLSPATQPDGSNSRELMYHLFRRIKDAGTVFLEWDVSTPSGRRQNMEISLRSFAIEGQDFAFAIMRDVTERKLQESRIIEERNRAEFYLDLLTHDVGNLHQGIYANLELMEMIAKPENGMTAKYMEQTLVLTRKSMQLIKYVKILSHPLGTQREVVDLTTIVESAITKARNSFPRKIIVFNVRGVEGRQIFSSSVIEEAIFNILHNAIKVQTDADPVVDMEAYDDGKFVSLHISDYGPGLSEERKATLFDRDRNGHTIKFTGIGLTLVKRLMDAFGDGVEVLDRVEGDPAKGLRFVLLFRRKEEGK